MAEEKTVIKISEAFEKAQGLINLGSRLVAIALKAVMSGKSMGDTVEITTIGHEAKRVGDEFQEMLDHRREEER